MYHLDVIGFFLEQELSDLTFYWQSYFRPKSKRVWITIFRNWYNVFNTHLHKKLFLLSLKRHWAEKLRIKCGHLWPHDRSLHCHLNLSRKKQQIHCSEKTKGSGLTLTMNTTISMTKTENLTLKMTKRSVLVVQPAPQDGRRTHTQRPLYPTTSVSGSERCFCM